MVDDRSTRELMTVAKFAFVVMTVGALIAPIPANSQLVGGVFGARARDSFGGTNGFGAELGVSLPLVPLEVFAAGTLFRPGCTGCDFKIWSVGAKLQIFPLPVLKPYVTVGRTWRDLEDPGAALILADDGFFTGAGLEFALPGFGLFAEGRYEFLPEDPGPSPDLGQWTMRVGLRMRWGGIPL
jgi:hypothetical protein